MVQFFVDHSLHEHSWHSHIVTFSDTLKYCNKTGDTLFMQFATPGVIGRLDTTKITSGCEEATVNERSEITGGNHSHSSKYFGKANFREGA